MVPFWLQLLKEAQQPQFNFPGFPAMPQPAQQPVQQAQTNTQYNQGQAIQPNQSGSQDPSFDVHRFHQELESLPSSFLGEFVQPYSIPRDKIGVVTKNLMALYEARRWYYDYIHWYIRYSDAFDKAQRPLDVAEIIAQVQADIDALEARRKAVEMKMRDEKSAMNSIQNHLQSLLSSLGSHANKIPQDQIDKMVSGFVERFAQQYVMSLMALESEINEINRQIAEKTTQLNDIQNQRPNSAIVAKYRAEQQANQKAAVEAYDHLTKAYEQFNEYLKNYPVLGEIINVERSISRMFQTDDKQKMLVAPDQTTLKLMMYRYYLMLRNTVYSGKPLETLEVDQVRSAVDRGAPLPAGAPDSSGEPRAGQPTTGGVGPTGGALSSQPGGATTSIGKPFKPGPAGFGQSGALVFGSKPGPTVFGRQQTPAAMPQSQVATQQSKPIAAKPSTGFAAARPSGAFAATLATSTPSEFLKNILSSPSASPSPTFLAKGPDFRDLLQSSRGQSSRSISPAFASSKSKPSGTTSLPGLNLGLV